MELVSLVDMWEREEKLDRETVGQVFKETVTLSEMIEYMLHNHHDFSVFYDGETHGNTLYADYEGYEYSFKFGRDDTLIEKSRHPYMD